MDITWQNNNIGLYGFIDSENKEIYKIDNFSGSINEAAIVLNKKK